MTTDRKTILELYYAALLTDLDFRISPVEIEPDTFYGTGQFADLWQGAGADLTAIANGLCAGDPALWLWKIYAAGFNVESDGELHIKATGEPLPEGATVHETYARPHLRAMALDLIPLEDLPLVMLFENVRTFGEWETIVKHMTTDELRALHGRVAAHARETAALLDGAGKAGQDAEKRTKATKRSRVGKPLKDAVMKLLRKNMEKALSATDMIPLLKGVNLPTHRDAATQQKRQREEISKAVGELRKEGHEISKSPYLLLKAPTA